MTQSLPSVVTYVVVATGSGRMTPAVTMEPKTSGTIARATTIPCLSATVAPSAVLISAISACFAVRAKPVASRVTLPP